jgi:hypothetical protein
VFLLKGVQDPATGARLTEKLHLDEEAIYLLRRGASQPVRVDVRDTDAIRDVALSPGLDRIAYEVTREVSCDPSYSVLLPFIAVADTSGKEIMALPGVYSFAWGDDGNRLAVAYGHNVPEVGYLGDSIAIIEVGRRSGTTYPLRAQFVEWLDPERLLLEQVGVRLFDLKRGKSKQVLRGGRFVSPDLRYSFTVGREGATPLVADDQSHTDLTRSVERLLEGGRIEEICRPTWVRREGAPHLLCVPVLATVASLSPPGPRGGPAAYVIDLEQRKVLRKIPGVAVASTPDGRAVVIYSGGAFRFEDL